MELLLEQRVPRLALHAPAAPVELEQHVEVEVGEDCFEVDTSRAESPIAVASCSFAASTIVPIGTCLPRSTTWYPLLVRIVLTSDLPMSCTSPKTVASTIVPFV